MKNLILAGLTALAIIPTNTKNSHKKCECSNCFINNNKSIRFNRKKKDSKNTKNQENRAEEI